MFESLLIANRGEIARRIIRTARKLGVRTVAVYSEADAGMPFVREADEAVSIGPAPASESYLVHEKIFAAARATGARAIHPGYGFLSENAEFAEAVQNAGLIWVGAPPAAIRAMGRKDAAKKLMQKAGVPVTPGYMGDDQIPKRLQAEADAIGYPVLIKAVAGGGGKGMRKVDSAVAFADALVSCQREAAASFGDHRVLVEKYILSPRHIEVQVFGDSHGNVVHLFERDCSLQRRHQKVIEEAPAAGMDEVTRQAICGAAVQAAKAVDYVGAGTIEFIADASEGLRADRIWFMEMNTRLQVEHPVTEAITGQDLVEWQLRVASGEPLPLAQNQLSITGWAMEARLYAENPASGFLPSTGRLEHLQFPSDIRVDSGVEQGCEVTPFYDPMIAKLVVHKRARAEAAAAMAEACGDIEVWPVKTNAAFLARAAAHAAFRAGKVDTSFIEQHAETLIPLTQPSETVLQAAAHAIVAKNQNDPWTALLGFRANADPDRRVEVEVGDAGHIVAIDATPPPSRIVCIADETVLFMHGEAWSISHPRPDHVAGGQIVGNGTIVSPMPGRVLSVDVSGGMKVAKGQKLLVLEAMKMEQTLRAPFDGLVAALHAVEGAQVAEGVTLMRIAKEVG